MALTRTPKNPLHAKYPGCTKMQIARLMCRAISMAATAKHGVCRFDLAEQMICEAMDLTEWHLNDEERERRIKLLRDALVHAESLRVGKLPFFRPLP